MRDTRSVGRLLPAPPHRSERRRRWQDGSFAALDFEATGLDFSHDRIISVGIVPVDDGRLSQDRAVYELVDPGPITISPGAFAVHGLRAEDLAGASPPEAARQTIREALAGRFLLTWHGIVEASFLGKLYGTSPRRWMRRSVDVRWLVLALMGADGAALTLSEAAGRLDVAVSAPHHALDDALVTAKLFLVAAERLASSGLLTTGDALAMGRARGPSARRLVVPR